MREIKFRAWDWEGERFLQVDYGRFVSTKGALIFYIDQPFQFGGRLELNQWAGLKDKNGKDIFEGDILSYPDTESEYVDVGVGSGMKVAETSTNSFWPVEFKDGEYGMNIKYGELVSGASQKHPEWLSLKTFFKDYIAPDECEVIGNIYEDSDLII